MPEALDLRIARLARAPRPDERIDGVTITTHAPGLGTAREDHMAAWSAIFSDPSVTHGLLLHEDLLEPQGWVGAVHVFLDRFPRQFAVALYTPRRAAASTRARVYGHLLTPAEGWRDEQALLLRREAYLGFARWLRDGEHRAFVSPVEAQRHDLLLAAFLGSRGVQVMVASPSLFQHDPSATHQAYDWPGDDPQWDAATHFAHHLAPSALLGVGGRFQSL